MNYHAKWATLFMNMNLVYFYMFRILKYEIHMCMYACLSMSPLPNTMAYVQIPLHSRMVLTKPHKLFDQAFNQLTATH